MTREEVNNYIANHGILPELKFGQNFLCDETIIEDIISASEIESHSKVLEIGPGIGALTRPLVEMDSDITCVEIDKRLAQYLSEDLPSVNIITSDYTKLNDYNGESFEYAISNIPYYVMTPIIVKLLSDLPNCKKMTFMIEEEAMRRIDAPVGTKQYGPLAVMCSCYGTVTKEFNVPRTAFVPQPHTLSCVITLQKVDGIPSKDFASFVNRCFSNRRKKLTNSVPEVKPLLAKYNLPEDIRAEKIEPQVFASIYKDLFC